MAHGKALSKYLTVQPAKQSWAHQSAAATAADSRDAVTGGELEAIWAQDLSSADRLTWVGGSPFGGIRKAVRQSCCRLMVFQRATNVTDACFDILLFIWLFSCVKMSVRKVEFVTLCRFKVLYFQLVQFQASSTWKFMLLNNLWGQQFLSLSLF